MTRAQWLALAERCEKAKGADRDIDAAIACAAFGWTLIMERLEPWGDCPMMVDADGKGPQIGGEYTGSLDAITSLIELRFPGGAWFSGKGRIRRDEPLGGARIFADAAGNWCLGEGEAATPALALCAAFCRAMAERAGQ